ncbi:MAG TPA: peptidylprolyl isomerase [Sphingomonadaceae bacterium]|nr:peptidylprolyl isomerase [Sphingomonadaceae bacterium]
MRKALGSFAALSALALTLSGCETLASIEESILGPLPEDQQAAAMPADGPAIVSGDTTDAPAPIAGMTPTAAIASAAPADWRAIDPANLLLMDLREANGQPARRVVIELAPAFAPVHVANIRAFTRAGWWNRSGIYRVQDNYVAQWGNGETSRGMPAGVVPVPPAEYDRDLEGQRPRPLGYRDAYAPAVGHLAGWPVAWNPRTGRVNLTHCYGMVGVGRGEAPDTGSGGELYAVIGHAPRHLDRNIAAVGRVIDGMDALSARPRGTEALGFYKVRSSDIPIARVTLAADLPAAQRPAYEVLDTGSAAFGRYVAARANRRDSFFATPAGGVDICNAPVPTRKR